MQSLNIYLAVDAANLFYALKRGSRLDYKALLQHAQQRGTISESAIYLPRDDGIAREQGLLVALKYMGYTRVISRSLRRRPNNQHKSDIDVALALDVWEAARHKHIDVVILVSGDSDFVPLVERLQHLGIVVDVIGPAGATAWDLIVASSQYTCADAVPGLIQPAPVTTQSLQGAFAPA
jgi:uncharacterized LabA/DUF88 family protein